MSDTIAPKPYGYGYGYGGLKSGCPEARLHAHFDAVYHGERGPEAFTDGSRITQSWHG